MDKTFKTCDYPDCSQYKRNEPDQHVDADVLQKFMSESDVLPLVEKKKFDFIRCRHYSLVRNEFLKCRWKHYKEKTGEKKDGPFKFPDPDDFHFYVYQTRYAPTQSQKVLMQRCHKRRNSLRKA